MVRSPASPAWSTSLDSAALRGCARGFKQHHIDGEALALHAHLKREGYECVFLDAYYRAVRRWWLMPALLPSAT